MKKRVILFLTITNEAHRKLADAIVTERLALVTAPTTVVNDTLVAVRVLCALCGSRLRLLRTRNEESEADRDDKPQIPPPLQEFLRKYH